MIFDETKCTLGEGPLWHPSRGELYWFDILSKRLHTKDHHWQFTRYVSAAGWVDDNRLLIADSIGLHVFDLATSTGDQIAEIEVDNPITRSNDGRADPWGGFWIGTMGVDGEAKAGAIYRYYRGEVRKLFAGISTSNAICFVPNATHAYFTDTKTRKIMRQKLAEKDGWPVGDPEVWLDFGDTPWGPDGAVVDMDGNFWNAQWGANRVACYAPDGTLTQTISFPAKQTSCPAFGGVGFKTLFCTSAGIGQSEPDDGKTFATPVDAVGQAEHQVIL
ncbi:SMP-30/gluconolactonase/LRE family protein [Octadecabacter sp. 1_MG-2023]|uniref:SMP-30/gluconolactonase/LRE family protein n=1 Tax=unclassified Octadecabacter TaxID=196158 RepID=UPI001C08F305|nr:MULTISPECIES: SMP-30/gluconolactonase/LRE family protein [unclassified Octadecabacter]MBU2994253.1 SMP-30/gluconolactonase/LRE family protein [Octadecabacter sp. B2R22]MDO6734458.1 SMP-30/gluconolactonase/LRE family protein [Octadecabacter sp. 1_MG-2023]